MTSLNTTIMNKYFFSLLILSCTFAFNLSLTSQIISSRGGSTLTPIYPMNWSNDKEQSERYSGKVNWLSNSQETAYSFSPSSSTPSSVVLTNNDDPAIWYFGNWKPTLNAPDFYSNDFKASNTQHNRCLFTFRGPIVRWFGSKNNNHGVADVYIDGEFHKTVDSYSATLIPNVLLFEKKGLSIDQVHTLMIVIKKDKNENSIDSYQDIDYFESSQPINYEKEITNSMNAEYKQIQNNSKPYALPSTWNPVQYKANAPLNGVSLQSGVINDVFQRNIKYLNHSFTSPTYCDGDGWSKWLPASNEGRMLTGAANTLRWGERKDMRNIVDTIINKIKNRVRPDGYHNYYPESESFALNIEDNSDNSERKNYDRVFWTRGLLDAGRSGNSEAYTIARNFYNWFNESSYLPKILLGRNATNGTPGGGLMYHSSAGTDNDMVITERYLDQDYWIDELSNRQPLIISDYPGVTPHCYELLGLEAFIDEYVATGNQKYIDAVKGGWEIYSQNFEHIGGSTAICEVDYFPPKSFYLNSHTGETCGSVFWTNINSRLLHLYPSVEKYATEIEKSIYNVIMAAQDTTGYIRYHNKLHGEKDLPRCVNSCCEVSSVGMMSKLPEYIYSKASDGLYVNLFVPSTIKSNLSGGDIILKQETSFPYNPDVVITLNTTSKKEFNLNLRVPSWASESMGISVNGKLTATGTPGTYVSIKRKWSDNDKINFTLPMSMTTVKYTGLDQINGNLDRYALLYGPLLMALEGPLVGPDNVPQIAVSAADLPGLLTPRSGDLLHFDIKGSPLYKYVPYWQVSGTFTCFPIIN